MATNTPWGPSQQSKSYGPGIVSYSCAGHGGFRVAPMLLATMPVYLRNTDGGTWFEEDQEWAKVALAFPDRFTSKDLGHAIDTIRNSEPDIYEKHFRVILESGESFAKDERVFIEEHKNDLIVVCASGDWKEGVPDGMVQVVAVRGGRGPCNASAPARETKTFLVPEADYDARGPHGFVVDPRPTPRQLAVNVNSAGVTTSNHAPIRRKKPQSMAIIRSIALTLANDRHSKAYAASIESVEGGGSEGSSYIVCSTYGAIGSIQKPGKGTPKPVTLEAAEKFYNKLVTEKTTVPCSCCAGLYVITGAAAATSKPVVSTALAHFPAFFPELLEPIAESETNRYLEDDQYSLEEKFDGTRLSVRRDADACAAYNRLGGFIPVPVEVEKAVRALGYGNIWLDGEFEHGQFVVYDLLQFKGEDYREHAQSYRRQKLERLLVDGPFMRLSREYLGTADKTAALAMFRKRGIEGVVFKNRHKPYMPGKQGVNRKLKFWESCTVRVGPKTKNDSAHSFGVEVLDAGVWKGVGNVSCKGPLPALGTFRECKYLYVGTGGSLYQPEDLGARSDVTDSDCDAAKLKHKAKQPCA